MTAAEALERANAMGAQVRLEGDRVILQSQANIPEELLEELRAHREEVIALLGAKGSSIAEDATREGSPGPSLTKEIETRLNEAFEIIDTRSKEADDRIQQSLERAFDVLEQRGSAMVEKKLQGAVDALTARDSELESLNARGAARRRAWTRALETAQAKLADAIERGRETVETHGSKLVEDRLNQAVDELAARDAESLGAKLAEALEMIDRRGEKTIEAKLADALDAVNIRGAQTVDARLSEARENVKMEGAQTVEAKLTEALETVDRRSTERIESKLAEVADQARVTVEARGAKVVDDRLREALNEARAGIESHNMALIQAQLTEALETFDKRGQESVESKLTEALETVKAHGAETVDAKFAQALESVDMRGAQAIDAKLTEALETVRALGAETVDSRLAEALDAVNNRGAQAVDARLAEAVAARAAETVEAKLTEVIEQARVTVETRGARFVDHRLKEAVDALTAREAETLDAKLADALEAVRMRGTETVEAGLRDAFERALRAFQTQEAEKPEASDQGPRMGESSTQERREPAPSVRRGLRYSISKRAGEPPAEAPVDASGGTDPATPQPNQEQTAQPTQEKPQQTNQEKSPESHQGQAVPPNQGHAAPPNQGRGERQREGRRRGKLWGAPPTTAPSQLGSTQGGRAEPPPAEGTAVETDKTKGKNGAGGASGNGERKTAPAQTPVYARPGAGTSPSARPGGSATGLQAGTFGRSPARVPIGTSMLLTAGSAAALAFGWAAGEASLIWTSVGSGMGAAFFLAVGHHRLAGRARHAISRPGSERLTKPVPSRTPAGQGAVGRPGKGARTP
jgi:hypothetical protein